MCTCVKTSYIIYHHKIRIEHKTKPAQLFNLKARCFFTIDFVVEEERYFFP